MALGILELGRELDEIIAGILGRAQRLRAGVRRELWEAYRLFRRRQAAEGRTAVG